MVDLRNAIPSLGALLDRTEDNNTRAEILRMFNKGKQKPSNFLEHLAKAHPSDTKIRQKQSLQQTMNMKKRHIRQKWAELGLEDEQARDDFINWSNEKVCSILDNINRGKSIRDPQLWGTKRTVIETTEAGITTGAKRRILQITPSLHLKRVGDTNKFYRVVPEKANSDQIGAATK